jgi:dTDP-4-dehydrorhamnose reductase
MTDKTILISGASGFIGARLFEKLKDLNPIGLVHQNRMKLDQGKIIKCDLRNKIETQKIIGEIQPDIIFHFAAMTNPKRNEENPEDARALNVDMTENLIHALDTTKNTHIIFLSTDKVFDGAELNPDETSKTNPLWLYGSLKLECEKLIENNIDKYHIIRLPIVHSCGEAHSTSFIDGALINLNNGKQIKAFKNVKRCYVRLNELIAFLEKLITDSHYGIYHAGSILMSYYDRISMLCRENGISSDGTLVPVEGGAKPLVQNLNTNKLLQTFNFTWR